MAEASRDQQMPEVLPRIGGDTHVDATRTHHRLAFNDCFERRAPRVEWLANSGSTGRQRPRQVARKPERVGLQAGDDRRAGVLALELADLPLAAQQPQRVVHAGLETDLYVTFARPRLQSPPGRNRWHQRSFLD
ncbi:MAG TPA: hypothetical protein VFG86_16400 [Chloroflexota bacterium]|nr:hypothetical protein [Chloroflexota bacterium]